MAVIELKMPARDRINAAIRNVEIAMLRGAEASIVLHARFAIRNHVTGKFPGYFKWRTLRLRKSLGSSVRRWRARKEGQGVTAFFGMVGHYSQALETGGTYQQTVKGHSRARPKKFTPAQIFAIRAKTGKVTKKGSGPVTVRRHSRLRRESARYIVASTLQSLAGVRSVPVERAMHILLTEGRLAKRSELTRGVGP